MIGKFRIEQRVVVGKKKEAGVITGLQIGKGKPQYEVTMENGKVKVVADGDMALWKPKVKAVKAPKLQTPKTFEPPVDKVEEGDEEPQTDPADE